ncbi:hypothetical protein [Levilactobacillus brevis]|uniref:hypothetical protein n=1 Tax=Levilactobacillus brevis TaxID=1580 RepID=UPI00374F035C
MTVTTTDNYHLGNSQCGFKLAPSNVSAVMVIVGPANVTTPHPSSPTGSGKRAQYRRYPWRA